MKIRVLAFQEKNMEPVFMQQNSCKLQLLAINALFEQARGGGAEAENCVKMIQEMLRLGEKVQADPHAVRVTELDDAQASILYHALLA
jgi:hypothetical protein